MHVLGEMGGEAAVQVDRLSMPSHTHNLMASASAASGRDPTNNPLARSGGGNAYQSNVNQNAVNMAGQAVGPTGGSQPHNNMQPYLG